MLEVLLTINQLKCENYFFYHFLVTSVALGQTRYWTSYNFSIDVKNEAAVYKLIDDYL
jgi:hypothetical protein